MGNRRRLGGGTGRGARTSPKALLPSATTTEFRLGAGYESEQAAALLKERLRGPKPVSELVIVQSPSLTVDDPQFQAKVESVYAQITALGPDLVESGSHYYLTNDSVLVSPDRRTTILSFVLAGDFKEATENVENVIHVVEGEDRVDGFRVLIGGDASVAFENNELSAEDLENGERLGIPVAADHSADPVRLCRRHLVARWGWRLLPLSWRWGQWGSSANSSN